ncbi:MAG: glycerophosphodiester phosphodiesterase family protein [Zhongshania sp.]|uniref:glycerophosphodiester phosphodiesterase family protein n=1 Tax=Zhongshania sp. TaxID=1971902 RepID=UPI002634321E|nr:glycerophosphodiester phosphodiesterase family protein [Zhongshania sp.]MDF1692799.1 glycerophosphodiester phosphodiesterase family protein [Zhongshania sp.]
MQAENFIAHRGWRQHYPENTLIAFQQAIAAGAVNIELDIQISADGVPFVFHDPNLQRMCGCDGLIWEYRADELLALKASESARLGNKFPDNPMCLLSDIVTLLQAHPKVNAYVEIKEESLSHFDEATVVDAIINVLRPVADRCLLISFELSALIYAQHQGWQRFAAVFDYWPDWQLASLACLNPEVIFCDKHCVPTDADLRALPWPLLVYEVGTLQEAKDWFARGAVAVETFLVGEMLRDFNITAELPAMSLR